MAMLRGLAAALAGIVAVLLVMALLHASQTALIVCVIFSGSFFGITNTLMTQVVMESAPVPRPIASSAYSFVRFCGGAIAPCIAGKLAEHLSVQAPFYLGAGMTAIAIGVLWSYRTALVPVPEPGWVAPDAGEIGRGALVEEPADDDGTLVVAVAGPSAREVCAMTVPLARARATRVHVLHVVERDVVVGEDAIDLESTDAAKELLESCTAELREAGVPVVGELLHSVGSHVDVARRILARAAELSATAIVLGPETRHGPLGGHVGAEIARCAHSHVIILHPEAGPLGRPDGRPRPMNPAQLWQTSRA
jgi:MFS transporter, ACDE family, multidrug resistance protein